MKIIRYIFCLLLLISMSTDVQAARKIATIKVPMAYASFSTTLRFYLTILTPEGVEYGEYKQHSTVLKVEEYDLVSWSGSSTAPIMKGISLTDLPESDCPGIDDYIARSEDKRWQCEAETIEIYTDEDLHGCPWIVSSHIESMVPGDPAGFYVGPVKVSSSCEPVPLAPYDVSWNESRVVHDKVVRLQSTSAVIEQTLPTYLMEGGKLCDGSKYDERGAYCRFVAQQMTFSTSGCDDAKVTVTPEPQPITSRQLHDMKLRVDTTAQQPIDATCRFTYILNMY
ncbi:adhesin [Escherichia coli]|uniref:StfH/YfcO family fimbrial adhesin n=1 Tax=Escherichia coli TaxID=562 RepID=UPI000BB718FD|nr:StfH/YfcO family fimbrial adhesin [Escherichia coli]PBU48879.1 adhesin [Escherichia coli]PBU53486.1 adhesin [Escherichia coli]PBU93981.1 adhesin [Escherichia coli]